MNTREKRLASLVGGLNNYTMQKEFQLAFLKRKELKPHHKLLDIGCGVLRGGLDIINYLDVGNYYGTECRDFVHSIAKTEAVRVIEKEPKLIHSDDLSPISRLIKFDYVWSFMVFIHMDDAIVKKMFKHIKERLDIDGRVYINVNIGRTREKAWQGFPVMWRPFKFYTDACKSVGLACDDLGSLLFNGHDNKLSKRQQEQQRIIKLTHWR